MLSAFGQIVTLGLTIAAAVLIGISLNDSASDVLVRLKASTDQAQGDLVALTARLPDIEQCHTDLLAEINVLLNCSEMAQMAISTNINLINIKNSIIEDNNAASLNTTLYNNLNETLERVAALEADLEASLNLTEATYRVVQNGTCQAKLVGGDNLTSTYEIRRLDVNGVKLIYMHLPAWTNSLRITETMINNPDLVFTQFEPAVALPLAAPNVTKPLLALQSERFIWDGTSGGVNATSYTWDASAASLAISMEGALALNNILFLEKNLSLSLAIF